MKWAVILPLFWAIVSIQSCAAQDGIPGASTASKPDAVDLESAPEGAARCSNSEEFLAALKAFKPIIALRADTIYDVGEQHYAVSPYQPTGIRILGGYDENWQRPVRLPPARAEYDSSTGVTKLPGRLKRFLDTGRGESIILRGKWQDGRSGQVVWSQSRGELNRITFVGSRNANAGEPSVIAGTSRGAMRYKDLMVIQRCNNGHAYMGFVYQGGEGSIVEDSIFYCPFVGLEGNCRPQYLIGSGDDPAQVYNQATTLRRSCILMPVNGGYHRLGFVGGTIEIEDSQFLSPLREGYFNAFGPQNLGFATDPTRRDVDWHVTISGSEFVLGQVTIAPMYFRKLTLTNNRFYTASGWTGPNATLWADREISIDDSNVFTINPGETLLPPAGQQFQQTTTTALMTRHGGKFELQPMLKGDQLLTMPVGIDGPETGEPYVLNPTVRHAPHRPVRYEGVRITEDKLNERLMLRGEMESVKAFDETYPALKDIP